MQFKKLDLNLLYVLATLFEERSVSQAAERLKVSQPTVSGALAKLRERFSDELFIRSSSGLVPTSFAETLREPLGLVMNAIDKDILREQGFSAATSKRIFRISMSDLGEHFLLPHLAATLTTQAPDCSIHCSSLPPRRLAEAMERGEVDVAVGYFPDLDRNAFHSTKLLDKAPGCIVRANNGQIGDAITLAQFKAAGHVLATHESRQLDHYEARVREMGIQRQIKVRAAHMLSVVPIIEATDYIAVVPQMMKRLSSGIRFLDLPFALPGITASLYWHHRAHKDHGITWLRQSIRTAIISSAGFSEADQ